VKTSIMLELKVVILREKSFKKTEISEQKF